jgi:hypothetical protein
MLDSSAQKGQFWLLWVVASTLGGVIVSPVVGSAAFTVGDAVGEAGNLVLAEVALGTVALGGFMTVLGLAQWPVLSRHASWAGRWLLANAASGAVGGAVVLGLFAATGSAVVAAALGLAVFGTTQWAILRRHLPWAAKLALASVLGLAVAGPLGGGAVALFFELEIASGAVFGVVYGAVTGLAIVVLSSRSSAV